MPIFNAAIPSLDDPLAPPRPRQSPTAGSQLMQMAGDTSTLVFSSGQGFAKLAAGALGGLAAGYEERQRAQQLAGQTQNGNAAAGGVLGLGGIFGQQPAPALGGSAPLTSFPSTPAAQLDPLAGGSLGTGQPANPGFDLEATIRNFFTPSGS